MSESTLNSTLRQLKLAAAITVLGSQTMAQSVPSLLDKGSFEGFIRSLNTSQYGYAVIEDPTGYSPTSKVERFEVRPGDCVDGRRWDDCKTDRERSELSEQPRLPNQGETIWYGWSFYLPLDWPYVYPTKTTLAQFHQEDAPPVWMFLNYKEGLVLDDLSSGWSARFIPLIDADELKGRWHRIEVEVIWSANEGVFRVWANRELKFDFKGQTTTADATYFRYGVYRSFVSRYQKAMNVTEVPAQWALFSNVKRASSRAGLN